MINGRHPAGHDKSTPPYLASKGVARGNQKLVVKRAGVTNTGQSVAAQQHPAIRRDSLVAKALPPRLPVTGSFACAWWTH